MELCDIIIQTNRVMCALNMEILDLLNEESISGARSGRASLKIRRKVLLRMFENVSLFLKYDSNFFLSTNIYIYMDTRPDHLTPLTGLKIMPFKLTGYCRLRSTGNKVEKVWKKSTDPMVGGAKSITLYDACTPSSVSHQGRTGGRVSKIIACAGL